MGPHHLVLHHHRRHPRRRVRVGQHRERRWRGDRRVVLLVGIAVDILWKPYWWSHGGQTPAYKMLRLRVVREATAARSSFGQAFLRLIGYIINGLVFGIPLGFIWVLFDSRRQGWHDKIANTVVIEA